MKLMLARGVTIAALALGMFTTTTTAQTRLNSTAHVGGSLMVKDNNSVFYRAISSNKTWFCEAPLWTATSTNAPEYGGRPVYDAPRKRFVGRSYGGVMTLTLNSGNWTPLAIYMNAPYGNNHLTLEGEVSVDMRSTSSDPRATKIFFRANGGIYVYQFGLVGFVPQWHTKLVTDIPGGSPVFDNYFTSDSLLYFRGTDSKLYQSLYVPATKKWVTQIVPGAPTLIGDPIVNAAAWLVYRDTQGRIASTWWNGSFWSTAVWNPTNNVVGAIVRGNAPGTVFYTGTDGNIWKCTNTGATTCITTAANAWSGTLVVNGLNQVFYRGKDNCLWRIIN